MLTPEFEELYERLVDAHLRYHDASRHMSDLRELARRRFDLDSVRSAIADERKVIAAAAVTRTDDRWLRSIGVHLPRAS